MVVLATFVGNKLLHRDRPDVETDRERERERNQFGFTRISNTLAAVVNLVTHVRQKMDDGRKVGIIFLDLRRAFDCVDHTLLLRRLQSLGVSGLSWVCLSSTCSEGQLGWR